MPTIEHSGERLERLRVVRRRKGFGNVRGPRLLVHLICPPALEPPGCESGGCGVVGVQLLIGRPRQHREGAVTTGPVVEDLDLVEDGGRQFDAGLPPLSVEELGLHPTPETLDHGVVERVADAADRLDQLC